MKINDSSGLNLMIKWPGVAADAHVPDSLIAYRRRPQNNAGEYDEVIKEIMLYLRFLLIQRLHAA